MSILGILKAIGVWILKNPVPILIAIAVAVFVWTRMENDRLETENESIKDQIEFEVDKNVDTQFNVVRVDAIQSEIARIREGQDEIRNRIDDIPTNEADRPFANDPGLLDRVDVMRDHQRAVREE